MYSSGTSEDAEETEVPDHVIDHGVLIGVFGASSEALGTASMNPLLARCKAALVRLFGMVPTVIRDKFQKGQFCSLPFAAVLAWAESDDLEVHSENCVVYLLSAWAQARTAAQAVTAAELEQLAHTVRVFHLCPTYLHHVLPSLQWFKNCSSMQHLPTLLFFKTYGLNLEDGLESVTVSNVFWEGAPRWMAKPRKCCSPDSSPLLTWVLVPSDVQRLCDGEVLYSPTKQYINGFFVKVMVQHHPSKSEPETTLGVVGHLDVLELAMWTSLGCKPLLSGTPVSTKLQALRIKIIGPDAATSPEKTLGPLFLISRPEAGRGWRDFLNGCAPTLKQLLAPYLKGGQLHIEARFEAFNETV